MAETNFEDLREYRRKHFKVEVSKCDHPLMENEMTVSVTGNGNQWQSISLSPYEAQKTVEKIQDYLASI